MALLGIAIIGIGVGGIAISSTSSRGSGPATLRNADFIRRADAICARLAPQIDAEYRIALAERYSGDVVAARRAVARVRSAARRLIREVTAVGRPAHGAATVATLLSEYAELIDDAIADTPDSNAAAERLHAQIASRAAQFGFRACGLT
jgi:hypothetical protein